MTEVPSSIEQEMRSSFLDYAMSVIVARALPDVRDGLKPVHRRILYAMYQLKNFYNRPYLKSARIVGDVIGRFHPHGDSAVYDALVRMAQEFSLRYPIVDGQGNFGSIDGDPPAAMRYTECRMQSVTELLLSDIERETVEFAPNYDSKEQEPQVLPARLPQLLINGTSGIAVGMATNMPPHNLGEVIDALSALIDNPDITTVELMQHIKAPDFPTRGIIHGVEGVCKAYSTGRGTVLVRGRAEIEEVKNKSQIIITEIPFQVNKARMIERIADLVREKKIDGIADLRDESAKEEIRVVIELKRGEIPDVVLNKLYKMTSLQSSFGINMVALVGGVPQLLNLKWLLREFYLHRQEVVVRRTAYLLRKAREKCHLLEGLKIATENIDAVVKVIRAAADSAAAQVQLCKKFKLSEIQAKAILDMRLARLTGLERERIIADYEETLRQIEDYQGILDDPPRVVQIIRDELAEIREKYSDERRTEVIRERADELTMESLVADEEVVLTITFGGYAKRTPLAQVRAQRRGGKGKSGILTKEEDLVKDLFQTTNHCHLLCFSNEGRVYNLRVFSMPEGNLRARGKHFANMIGLKKDEKIVSVLPVRKFTEDSYVISCTEKGMVKKTLLTAYANVRSTGIIGLKLDKGDTLIKCALIKEGDQVLIASRQGKAIRFDQKDVRPMMRASRGVTGMRFGEKDDKGDYAIGMEVIGGEGTVFSVCENGYGKRTSLSEYREQSRGGKGIFTIKVTERNGPVVGVTLVEESDDLMIITSAGKITRFNVSEVGVIGRVTQGVRIMNIDNGEKVAGFTRADKVEGEEV